MSIIYKAKSRRSGFTLVELVCVFVIMAVLTAMIVPVSMKWIEKVRVRRYISEARGVWDSVRLYAVETYVSGTLDTMELMEELTQERLDSEKNPLRPYLLTECSKGAAIEDLTLDTTCTDVIGIVYLVDRYRIEIDQGDVNVTLRE